MRIVGSAWGSLHRTRNLVPGGAAAIDLNSACSYAFISDSFCRTSCSTWSFAKYFANQSAGFGNAKTARAAWNSAGFAAANETRNGWYWVSSPLASGLKAAGASVISGMELKSGRELERAG